MFRTDTLAGRCFSSYVAAPSFFPFHRYGDCFLAVSFAAMADGGDRDGLLACGIEEHAVVATAEAEAGERRFKFLHVARMIGQVVIDAV